ncbi:MAG: DUF3501 family protein [Gammaproteobacteria bacterium]
MPDLIQLKRHELLTLEDYAIQRDAFRTQAIEARKARRFHFGEHFTFNFENKVTVQYQVQEMLRIERIFEPKDIEEELSSYNPLISQGHSLRCTLFIEFEDVGERQKALATLSGVEHQFWVEVEGHSKTYADANQDIERSTDEKTSAVHFLNFKLPQSDIDAFLQGANLRFGMDHDGPYAVANQNVPSALCETLRQDLS